MPNRIRDKERLAFTLVELLVVIGIIALLISILLPALNQARQRARTIQCMANLKQTGIAIHTYASQYKGIMVPADYFTSDGRPYAETWASFLVIAGALPVAPRDNTATSAPETRSVWICPENDQTTSYDVRTATGYFPVPTSPTDPFGTQAFRYQSTVLNRVFDIGYGINCDTYYYDRHPFSRLQPDLHGSAVYSKMPKKTSDVMALYDGQFANYVRGQTNPFRINQRHGKQTNLLFLDGHAGGFDRAALPMSDAEFKNSTAFGIIWRFDSAAYTN